LGSDRVISKPLDIGDLKQALRELAG
jgi:hypothetical protein